MVLLALAVFGAGQGLFISPTSGAIMAAAPGGQTGQAASVLNVARLLGISPGIAAASTVLALSLWGTGGSGGTLGITAPLLTAAGRHVIFLLAGLIALAGLLSLFAPGARAHPENAGRR